MKCRNLFVGMMALLLTMPVVTQAASFLENEAGISASIQVTGVGIPLAATAFKAIEKQSDGYIIGSVALPDYDETHDVHVYVDISGNMIAYYLKEEEASKIIDWKHDPTGALAGCKLEDALSKVCEAMSVTLPTVKYYDFRYPNATSIKIITDEALRTTDTFRFMIPSNHIIYNSTWSHAVKDVESYPYSGSVSQLDIDGVLLHEVSFNSNGNWRILEGRITADLITPDIYHEIAILPSYANGYGAIVLQYRTTP